MQTRKISKHKNFHHLTNLNSEIEEKQELRIDLILDNENEHKDELLRINTLIYDTLNLSDEYSFLDFLFNSKIKIILYKGELHVFKKPIEKAITLGYIKTLIENEKQGICSIQKPRFLNLNKIIAHLYFKTRSYFITPEKAIQMLNIDYDELNILIKKGIIRVIVRRSNVFFSVFQLKEILHILETGEDYL